MKAKFKFLLILIFPLNLFAQQYSVALMPDSLTKKANAVLRTEELKIIIKDIDKAEIHHKYAMTILNDAGKNFSVYYNNYNKLVDLNDIDGNLYDAFGKRLKNVKRKDIADFTSGDASTLITDTRIKMHNFYYGNYPYTVEYEDEQDFDGIFYLPHWTPQKSGDCAVEQSRFVVETPIGYKLRYKQFKYANTPQIINDGKKITYVWEVKNLNTVADEPYSPDWNETTTSVYVAPTDFKMENYTGKMDTWLNLGKFIAQLNQGRDVLPENVKRDVHNLTDNLKAIQEKAFVLYNYLQQSTRYVLVKLGIGGWQPLDASYVATKRYGDCKALSNYMKSLLKEAGIKSYYVLVNGDDEDLHGLWADFPSPYFNHAVLCVPNTKDTLWFECTNQTIAPGYMSSFTGNRKALLIDDDGGHIVNTPNYNAEDNMQVRAVKASIDSSGKLEALLSTTYTGVQQDMPHALINDFDKNSKEKFLNNELNLPTYKVNDSKYVEKKSLIPEVKEQLNVTALAYATISGKRLFIKPNLFNKVPVKLNEDETRLFNIDYPYSFHDIDSIEIKIPEGYIPESSPKNIVLSSKFGDYGIEYEISDNKILVTRNYKRSSGQFPASDYKEFVKFYNDMFKADRTQIVLIKKDS